MDTDPVAGSRPLRIFLSSTVRDLLEYRKAAVEIIDLLGHAPIRMEAFGARAGQSLAECRRLAAEADAMVAVVAHRYGWVPKSEDGGDGEKSITWYEVEAAVSAGKPVFRYLCDDTTASADHHDDDVRLELFRQVLRRRPCDTFSTPDDLAKKVAVALGDWSRRRARDFASALQMIDLTGYKPQPATLRASTFFQAPLIRLVLQVPTVSSAELDQVVEGSHLRAARTALAQHAQRCDAQLSALESQLSKARAHVDEIRALVEQLVAERPPKRPASLHAFSEPSSRIFDDRESHQQARQYAYEVYLRAQQEHQQEVGRYEVSLTEYDKRQAMITGQRLRLETAQQSVSQLEFNLARLTNDCASERRRLTIEIGIARDQDISALLRGMRDRGAQQVADSETLSRGFLLLLATDLSSVFLSEYLSGTSATLWVEQVGKDVSEVAEETVRREHQRLGKDCLALVSSLADGFAQGMEITSQIRGALDALPQDELRRFCSESQDLLAFEVPTVEPYHSLISPESIARASSNMGRQRAELGQSCDAIHTLFDESATLHASVHDTRTYTTSLVNQMEEAAAERQPWLDDCELAWTIISRATQSRGLGADTKEFCACLQTEAERRLGEPAKQLVARCDTREFGVRDAKAALAGHAATAFLRQSKALKERLTTLEARAAEFNRAGKDIEEQPWRQAETYRKRLRLTALLTFMPMLDIVCVLYAGTLVRRYDSAIRSNHPAYLDLGRWNLPWLLWATGISAAGVVASAFALLFITSHGEANYDESIVPLLFLSLFSYVVSVILWSIKTVRVLGIMKQRRQNGLEQEGA